MTEETGGPVGQWRRLLNDNGELSHRLLGGIWKKESISYK
ncbi:hypothetical protein QFZ72_002583 [Bacillus sp. V2I10]|nr:hypothetical protein [Bacillus sp. V2I10]